jgi:hypothetical protein
MVAAGVIQPAQTLQATARHSCVPAPPVHTPPWQTPMLQPVLSSTGVATHSPVAGTHETEASHSPNSQVTPAHRSVEAALEGLPRRSILEGGGGSREPAARDDARLKRRLGALRFQSRTSSLWGCGGKAGGSQSDPPVHTPPWQEPALHSVPFPTGVPGPHCPVAGSHVPASDTHSPDREHSTPTQRSVVAGAGRQGWRPQTLNPSPQLAPLATY